MSDRRMPTQRTAARDRHRVVDDRLAALEKLVRGMQTGTVPFTKVVVRGVEITVTDTVGDGKDVTILNPGTGLSQVWNL